MVLCVHVKGHFWENCYFYIDDNTKHGFLIDPGAQAEKLLKIISNRGWVIEKILLTHGHFDHMGAVEGIRDVLDIPVYAHKMSDEYLLDAERNLSSLCGSAILIKNVKYLDDGEIILLKSNPNFCLKVVYTPGHTTDSIVFYNENDNIAFVGDTIFKGSIGNYQYPGGNKRVLIKSILEKILTLPKNTILYSGHSDSTTVEIELKRYGLNIK